MASMALRWTGPGTRTARSAHVRSIGLSGRALVAAGVAALAGILAACGSETGPAGPDPTGSVKSAAPGGSGTPALPPPPGSTTDPAGQNSTLPPRSADQPDEGPVDGGAGSSAGGPGSSDEAVKGSVVDAVVGGIRCPGFGWYCGGDGIIGGDSGSLYYCAPGAQYATFLGACALGCVQAGPNQADYCQGGASAIVNPAGYPGEGWWCGGQSYGPGQSGHLYFFDAGYGTDLGPCPSNACSVEPAGSPDKCASTGPPGGTGNGNLPAFDCNGKSGWYCSDDRSALMYCASSGARPTGVRCPIGCQVQASGVPDSCKIDRTRLMSNAEFTGDQQITAAQVEDFLRQRGSGLYGRGLSQVIVEQSKAYHISPVAMLARIQTESANIEGSGNTAALTGCGCPDSGGCDPSVAGAANQIACTAQTYRGWYDQDPVDGGQSFTSDCGTLNVQNRATYSLYKYTPWVGYYATDNCGDTMWGGSSLAALLYYKYKAAYPW